MRVLITGACGFVGSRLAAYLRARRDEASLRIVGIDNLSRRGSELNRRALARQGIRIVHGDVRWASDLEAVGPADWVIDAAANPSVLAGSDGKASSRQVFEHNLVGTGNTLEYCKTHGAGFILLSTSRVYSIAALHRLALEVEDDAFRPALPDDLAAGAGPAGVRESFSTAPPVSLYGATKLASEILALEYHHSFGLPVWINRCGVLGGAGQFGHAEQGIFSYWIHAHLRRRPLRYIGFDGRGHQVRDCLHPDDLGALVLRQLEEGPESTRPRLINVAGGAGNAISLAQLSRWCDERFGRHPVEADPRPRPFDVPWLVLDPSLSEETWGWKAVTPLEFILEEIARHAEDHPDWLEISGAYP